MARGGGRGLPKTCTLSKNRQRRLSASRARDLPMSTKKSGHRRRQGNEVKVGMVSRIDCCIITCQHAISTDSPCHMLEVEMNLCSLTIYQTRSIGLQALNRFMFPTHVCQNFVGNAFRGNSYSSDLVGAGPNKNRHQDWSLLWSQKKPTITSTLVGILTS